MAQGINPEEYNRALEAKIDDPNILKPQNAPDQNDNANATLFEQWTQSILETQKANIHEMPTMNLSRFGLKTPQDVVSFLRSPAGDSFIAELGAEISRHESLQQQQRIEQQSHQLMMNRLKALLFLWFLEEESDAADKIKEIVLNQNEQAIDRAGNPLPAPSGKTNDAINKEVAHFDEAINAEINKLAAKNQEAESLQTELSELFKQEKHMKVKYDIYEANLKVFEKPNNDYDKLTVAELNLKIHETREQMKVSADEIISLVSKNEEDTARLLLEEQNGLNLKIGHIIDIVAVRNQKKYYADAQGNEVNSYSNATFILLKNQKIVEKEGKYYLMNDGKDWNSIKDNQEAQVEAQKNFEALKPQIMTVTKVVHHNKNIETTLHQKQVEKTVESLGNAIAEKLLISNQIKILQSARANAQNLLNQPRLSQDIPRPTPTAAPASVPKPNHAAVTLFYREQIKLLTQKSATVTPEALFNLVDEAPGDRVGATVFLQQKIGNMPRTAPIPHQMLQSILREMERLGIDAANPAITNIKSPSDLKEQAATMTPFNTKLTPR